MILLDPGRFASSKKFFPTLRNFILDYDLQIANGKLRLNVTSGMPVDCTCCLVSEFIQGSTLAERLSAKRFGFRQAAELK